MPWKNCLRQTSVLRVHACQGRPLACCTWQMRKGFALGLVLLGAGGAWLTMRLTLGHGSPSGVEARAVQSADGTGLEGDRDAEIVELQRRVTRLEQAERARAQKAGETLRAETEAAAEDA